MAKFVELFDQILSSILKWRSPHSRLHDCISINDKSVCKFLLQYQGQDDDGNRISITVMNFIELNVHACRWPVRSGSAVLSCQSLALSSPHLDTPGSRRYPLHTGSAPSRSRAQNSHQSRWLPAQSSSYLHYTSIYSSNRVIMVIKNKWRQNRPNCGPKTCTHFIIAITLSVVKQFS